MQSCSLSFVKLLLFIFNLVFCLSGIALIAVGSYVLVELGDYKTFLEDKVITAPIILITTGSIIFLISLFGCCGAKRESKCMLQTFIAFLIVVIILEITVGAIAAVYKNEFSDALKTALESSIKNGKESDMEAWDILQKNFKCCGVEKWTDWGINVPESCKKNNLSIWQEGCYSKLRDFVDDNTQLLLGIAFGLVVIKVIGIIFASCMSNGITREHHYA